MVRLKSGTFKNSYIKLPGAKASAATARAANTGKRQLASNILIVSGSKSATGKPLFVGGPQIGFNYPGLTMEMQLTSPSINVEGVTSAPFPGYMLIGHGVGYAWSLTSAGADIIDTYAEKLCGGSKTKYVWKGRCRAMEKVSAGTIGKGGKTVTATFYRTVHGPVVGYATDRSTGKKVALSQKRSSYGRETVDQLFNQQMTYSRVHSAKDFIDGGGQVAADVQLVLRERDRVRVLHVGRDPDAAQGRQRRPPGRRHGPVRVDGRAGEGQAPAGRQPGVGHDRQLEQQAGQGLPGRRRPLRQRGRDPARRHVERRAGAVPARPRWPTCWRPPTRAPRRTSGSRSCGRR